MVVWLAGQGMAQGAWVLLVARKEKKKKRSEGERRKIKERVKGICI